MTFDWTLNLGHVISFVLFLATIIGAHFAIKVELKGMSKDMGFLGGRLLNVENTMKELTTVTISMAENSQKMKAIEDRMLEQTRRLNTIDEQGSRNLHKVIEELIVKLHGSWDNGQSKTR